MSSKTNIDLSLLSDIQRMMYLSPAECFLIDFPSLPKTTANRLFCSVHFASLISGNHGNGGKHPDILAEGYFRSSLTEYSSVFDVLKTDRKLNISDFRNPLIHLLKLLRNIQIHISSTRIDPESISAQTIDGFQFQTEIHIIQEIPEYEIKKLDSLKLCCVHNYVTLTSFFR